MGKTCHICFLKRRAILRDGGEHSDPGQSLFKYFQNISEKAANPY